MALSNQGYLRFSTFQAVSAYTNTGMSLVDQSMVPFQTAYPMIIIMFSMVLAGNTAFVSFGVHICQIRLLTHRNP